LKQQEQALPQLVSVRAEQVLLLAVSQVVPQALPELLVVQQAHTIQAPVLEMPQ